MSDAVATTRRREATRHRLLTAAADVFAEIGLDAASVEAICERAGFTRGAFYSNFESKDELMLELAASIAEQKIAAVRDRVLEVDASDLRFQPEKLVLHVLDAEGDDRAGILLANEIQMRAMRDRTLAATYARSQDLHIASITALIDDVARRFGMRLRLPSTALARVLMQTWEASATSAVIDGLSDDARCTLVNSRVAEIAVALIDSPEQQG